MKSRCLNPKHLNYSYYGGRGIKICARWMTFENYVKDVGMPKKANCQLDRIDNNGDYEPSNVRWTTVSKNMKNRRAFGNNNTDTKLILLRSDLLNQLKALCKERRISLKDFLQELIKNTNTEKVKKTNTTLKSASKGAIGISSEIHKIAKQKAYMAGMSLFGFINSIIQESLNT